MKLEIHFAYYSFSLRVARIVFVTKGRVHPQTKDRVRDSHLNPGARFTAPQGDFLLLKKSALHKPCLCGPDLKQNNRTGMLKIKATKSRLQNNDLCLGVPTLHLNPSPRKTKATTPEWTNKMHISATQTAALSLNLADGARNKKRNTTNQG